MWAVVEMLSSLMAKPVLPSLKAILRLWVNTLSEIFFSIQSIKPLFLVIKKSIEVTK